MPLTTLTSLFAILPIQGTETNLLEFIQCGGTLNLLEMIKPLKIKEDLTID